MKRRFPILSFAWLWLVVCQQTPAAMAFKNASDFLVQGLEKIEPAFAEFDGDMYAGMLPIDIQTSEEETPRGELMFWLFKPRQPKATDTLTIWFNGGPGCTSFEGGVMFECSPVTTPHHPAGYWDTPYDEPLVPNEWAWTKATNMLFVEQPAGTGFSYGPQVHSEADLSQDFYNFLMNFYETFPEMQPKRLFLFGESYAGYYVPSIAHKIHLENKNQQSRMGRNQKKKVNLKGIGIGNAWMDSKKQGPMAIDYAYWHGMIDSTTKNALHAIWEDCMEGKKMDPPFHDFNIPDECNIMGGVLEAAGAGVFPDRSPNTYDVTTWDKYMILNGQNTTYIQFYNNPEVKEILHAPMDTHWQGCIPGAGRRLEEELPGKTLLAHDKPESVVPYIAELLDEAGIRVLVYNADRDLSVNAQGSELLLDEMDWSGADEWKTASRGLWMVDNKVAGYVKTHNGLDFVIVYNSGHLVPHNVPEPALDLITRFVTDKEYNDIALPTFSMPKKPNKKKEAVSQEQRPTRRHSRALLVTLICGVAVISFVSGILVDSYRHRKRRRGYAPIAESPKIALSI